MVASPEIEAEPSSIPIEDRESISLTVRSLIGVLDQLSELIEGLTDEQYAIKPTGAVTSSIGGHIRHNLDHFEALLRGIDSGYLSYDHRDRDPEIERNRFAALRAIGRVEEALLDFPWYRAPRTVHLSVLVSPDAPSVMVASSIGRELAFVLSHTIHHNALIGVMVRLLGAAVPTDFGYAPSTLAHQRSRRCVR